MFYVVPALIVVFAILVWVGRRTRQERAGAWRLGAAAMSVLAATGGVAAAMRGGWPVALVLAAVSAWLGMDSRGRGPQPQGQGSGPAPQGREMGEAEARSILGVGEGASATDIQTAYLRLMRSVHPDAGGTSGLASQLNAARDRLLGKA
jgi:hypothetical protein